MEESKPSEKIRLQLNSSLSSRDSSLTKDGLLQNCFLDTLSNGSVAVTKRPGFYVGSEAVTTGFNRGVYYNPYDGGTYYIDEQEALQKLTPIGNLLFQTAFYSLTSFGVPFFNVGFVGLTRADNTDGGYCIYYTEDPVASGNYKLRWGTYDNFVSNDSTRTYTFSFTEIAEVSVGATPSDVYSFFVQYGPLTSTIECYMNSLKVGEASYIPYNGVTGGSINLLGNGTLFFPPFP